MWKYNRNDQNTETRVEWAEENSLNLIFDAKDRKIFRFAT